MKAEDLLHFVNLDEFTDDWRRLGLDEDDLWLLELCLMSDPSGPPVIPGTGGLRKVRFSPAKWTKGKRGAIRILYVYFPDHWIVLLVKAYGKNEREGISETDKKGIREYIRITEQWLKTTGGDHEPQKR